MADQDFNITIKTVADTTGIKLTEQGLNAIKTAALQGNQQAIAALKNLTAAQKEAQSASTTGFTGSAVGVGTIVSVLTMAINRWKQFNDEQDKIIEKMMEVTRRNYELAQSILATQDAAISARRTATEPLADSYIRLQQEIVKLQTEQGALNLPNQSKEWEELQKQINAARNELRGVEGDLKKAGVTDVTPIIPGPKAGKGESQALVDEIERNRKAAEEQMKEDIWEYDPETGGYRLSGKKQFPVFQPPPQPTGAVANQRQYGSPIGPPIEQGGGLGHLAIDMIEQAFMNALGRYFGP